MLGTKQYKYVTLVCLGRNKYIGNVCLGRQTLIIEQQMAIQIHVKFTKVFTTHTFIYYSLVTNLM